MANVQTTAVASDRALPFMMFRLDIEFLPLVVDGKMLRSQGSMADS
jgi:hypothetical protein